MLKHRGIQVLLVSVAYLACVPFLPEGAHRFFYTCSLGIKDILLWALPLSVGLFIAHAVLSFERRAPLFVITLFLFEMASNALSVWYAYGCGLLSVHDLQLPEHQSVSVVFEPLWRLAALPPAWWSAGKGTVAGLLLGLCAIFVYPPLGRVLAQGKRSAEWVLTRCFARLIPLFVLGFLARMYKTQLINQLAAHGARLLLWLIGFLALYIAALFLIGCGGSWRAFLRHVRHLLPAGYIAFSSGCSLSTMPWTIEGASKNMQNPDLAKAVIPATTNIQQVGDCIANAFLCVLLYAHFNGAPPPLTVWIPFSLLFVLARFATAAVLGGAIFLMLPIYESYLDFSPEMIAIILAFNVILDPLVTCSNVMGNGALCRVFERVARPLGKRARP
jgi:hypothetical protein